MNGPSRRAFLVGGLAAACAACAPHHDGPTRASSHPAGGASTSTRHPVARTASIRKSTLISGAFTSRLRHGARTGWTIAYPPGHSPGSQLPVLVALHGRYGFHTDAFSRRIHLGHYLTQQVHAGMAPFAIASVDGGADSYWHPRRSGDTAGMVVEEFLPILARRGLRTERVGLLGWSMGGYGALYLATVLTRTRCAVAIAESPAVWRNWRDVIPGSFDDEQDFAEHDIYTRLARLHGIPLRIDCGAQDSEFVGAARELRAAITPTPAGGIEAGKHNVAFWESQAPAQLRFAARYLTSG